MSSHLATNIVDAFEEKVWRMCLPNARSRTECLAEIHKHPSLFLNNLKAFAKYLILDNIGIIEENKETAKQVLEDLEERRQSPIVNGLREWAMECVITELVEMLGTKPKSIAPKKTKRKRKLKIAKKWMK